MTVSSGKTGCTSHRHKYYSLLDRDNGNARFELKKKMINHFFGLTVLNETSV